MQKQVAVGIWDVEDRPGAPPPIRISVKTSYPCADAAVRYTLHRLVIFGHPAFCVPLFPLCCTRGGVCECGSLSQTGFLSVGKIRSCDRKLYRMCLVTQVFSLLASPV
ncbi:hypothetical protein CEXT_618361 [Caerostris extrusa]|uniref:Uncharacterized protein n=1 Tax=Caerostris extrusa TaxID=172846 RepID=A0AAV4WCI6_CAEEX|nr:hypothetical protein CEXT_618361 [Caerostris extrusa]